MLSGCRHISLGESRPTKIRSEKEVRGAASRAVMEPLTKVFGSSEESRSARLSFWLNTDPAVQTVMVIMGGLLAIKIIRSLT